MIFVDIPYILVLFVVFSVSLVFNSCLAIFLLLSFLSVGEQVLRSFVCLICSLHQSCSQTPCSHSDEMVMCKDVCEVQESRHGLTVTDFTSNTMFFRMHTLSLFLSSPLPFAFIWSLLLCFFHVLFPFSFFAHWFFCLCYSFIFSFSSFRCVVKDVDSLSFYFPVISPRFPASQKIHI